jgi:hypothetical protein
MNASQQVDVLAEYYPEFRDFNGNINDFIVKKKVNYLAIITGIGNPDIKAGTPTCQKILLAINDIYIKSSSSLSDFFNRLAIDEYWLERLSRGVLMPNRNLIDILIKNYKVNPTYIFDNSNKMYIND